MESKTVIPDTRDTDKVSEVQPTGGFGTFQALVLGLVAFTALMVLMALVMSLFMNIGG